MKIEEKEIMVPTKITILVLDSEKEKEFYYSALKKYVETETEPDPEITANYTALTNASP